MLRKCHDYTTQFTLHRLKNDGSKGKTVEKSVRDILQGMEWEGEKIFLMVTRIKGGHIGACFCNVIDSCKERVVAMANAPAAQIYWKAYKRGVYVEDINRMLVHCFDVREVNKIPSSRYSKTQKWL